MFCVRNILISIPFIALTAAGCGNRNYLLFRSSTSYALTGKAAGAENDVAVLVRCYKDSMQMCLLDTIAYARQPLTKAQPESTLGNLVADAVLAAARQEDPKVCAAIIPFHNLGQSYVAPGAITRQHCYDILPEEHRLLIIELTGTQIKTLCDTIARCKGWPLSGLTFVIDSGSSRQHQINGTAIHDQLLYKIAVSDYIAGDRILGNIRPQAGRHYLSCSLRGALVAYIEAMQLAGKELQSQLENRIRYAD